MRCDDPVAEGVGGGGGGEGDLYLLSVIVSVLYKTRISMAALVK